MTNQPLSFADRHAFNQAAFDQVGQIVFSYAEQIIISGKAAPVTAECLEQLEFICQAWGYDATKLTIWCDQVKEENQEILDREGEIDHD